MMDKTININISGTLFQIDEEAFRILKDYLQSINNRFRNVQGGHETIEDIESRIAEIFQSQNGLAGVISRENVESMIAIIGKPEDFDHPGTEVEPPVYTSQRKRMYRNPDDSIISGVCGGLGAYLNTDPVVFRILFILFTVFFGVGLLVYIALWIALPPANTDARKREMFGDNYNSSRSQNQQPGGSYKAAAPSYNRHYDTTSRIGNAFNEIFRAIGSVIFIIVRIFLIIIGVALVLTGFLALLSFVMVFVFKIPGAFSTHEFGVNFIYLPDFLHYIVSPAAAPWILVLSLIAFALPMLALIYWGVKMIFWFRAKDGVLSLVALVIWVLSIATLSIILFNEGISFAETASKSIVTVFPKSSDTIYIATDRKIADLKYEKEISFPHEQYTVYFSDEKNELYIRPTLSVYISDDKLTRVEVTRQSAGKSEMVAIKKTDDLLYNYSVKGDTLRMDEIFTIPSGRKWEFDKIKLNLYAPEGTILKLVEDPRITFHSRYHNEYDEMFESRWESANSSWVLTEDGLKPGIDNFEKLK